MAGNVAEWCETAYDESMYEFSHDLNADYRYDAMDWDPPSMKRKVITRWFLERYRILSSQLQLVHTSIKIQQSLM
jgi:hypothetical protein